MSKKQNIQEVDNQFSESLAHMLDQSDDEKRPNVELFNVSDSSGD